MTDAEKHKRELLLETSMDIAMTAGYLIAMEEIDVADSRELIMDMAVWAGEFEEWYAQQDQDSGEYLDAIDDYAEQKLRGKYGRRQS